MTEGEYMMKLVWFELKKITGSKVLCIFLVALAVINFAVTLYISKPAPYEDVVRDVYYEYLEDPEAIESYFLDLRILSTLNFEEDDLVLPSNYTGDPSYDDLSIISRAQRRKEYLDTGFEKGINNIIRMSVRKIDDLYGFNATEGHYEIKNQTIIAEKYEELLAQTEIGSTYSYGYDSYLKNNTVSIFIALFVIVLASFTFLNERTVGFEQILRTTAKGRGSTFIAKVLAVIISVVLSVFIFQVTSFIAVGIAQGYSSPFVPIQSLPDFGTIPYDISILEYVTIHFLLRCGAFIVLAMFVSAFGAVKLPYIACIGGGCVFSVINQWLFSADYLGTVPPRRFINLASMVEGTELLSYYRTLNLFGRPTSYILVIVLLFALLLVFFIAVAGVLYGSRIDLSSLGINKLKKIRLFKGSAETLSAKTSRSKGGGAVIRRQMPLCFYEMKKNNMVLSILFAVILLIGRGKYVDQAIGNMERYDQAVYYEYISEVRSLDKEARDRFMREERAYFDSIISKADKIRDGWYDGSVDDLEYYEYHNVLSEIKAKEAVFSRVENYVKYIDQKNEETGFDGRIIYSIGYERFFSLSTDFFLFAALLILNSRSFSVDYSSNTSSGSMYSLIHTTKLGRKRTFNCKVRISVFFGGVIALLYRCLGFYITSRNYLIEDINNVLYSVSLFPDITSDLTIFEYLLIDLCVQFFIGASVSLIICMLSLFCKKNYIVIGVSLLCLVIPELLATTVLHNVNEFSIISLSAPQYLFNKSATMFSSGTDLLYFGVVLTVILVIDVVLNRIGYCHFNKEDLRRRGD